jgi:hypothetical protein
MLQAIILLVFQKWKGSQFKRINDVKVSDQLTDCCFGGFGSKIGFIGGLCSILFLLLVSFCGLICDFGLS